MLNVLSVKTGEQREVKEISSDAPFKIKRRLLELGFTKKTKVKVHRKSLLGQAYMVELRGFILSMKKDILRFILVE